MMWLAKWLSIPILVLVVATSLALAYLLETGWVISLFAVLSFIVLFIWRRAAFRLVPWFSGAPPKDMDPILMKKVSAIAVSMMFGSLIVQTLTLVTMIFLFQSLNTSKFTLVCTIMFVTVFSKFGIMTILIRRMLDHEAGKTSVLPSIF
jgi:hypothetical protein